MLPPREHYESLRELLPGTDNFYFNGRKDSQDFLERDYDRRVNLLLVESLISILEVLKEDSE